MCLLFSLVCSTVELYCNKLYNCQKQCFSNLCQLLINSSTYAKHQHFWLSSTPILVSYLSLSVGLINVIAGFMSSFYILPFYFLQGFLYRLHKSSDEVLPENIINLMFYVKDTNLTNRHLVTSDY